MERFEKLLKKRLEEGTLRSLSPCTFRNSGVIQQNGRKLIDFSSNDYLGFSNDKRLFKSVVKALETYGAGSGASRLMSGDLDIHHALEEKIACFKGKEKALIFNSGYQANIGIIPAICNRHDAILADRACHASQLDGIELSGAKLFRFRHNDVDHLKDLLAKERSKFEQTLIVTESVFSMDGDLAPLKSLVELKEQFNCWMMVDEAHATGVFGNHGEGLVFSEGLNERVEFVMGTFSKALGGFGAYLASSRLVIDYLVNFARSFIFSTALPPSIIAANIASLEICQETPGLGRSLLEKANNLRKTISGFGWKICGESQIIPVIIGGSKDSVMYSDKLKEKGLKVVPVRPPTVPEASARLRISLSLAHSETAISTLIGAFRELS
ncbi:MAG: 8-amino-7-oxononanoate synthase [Candidatus Riflebacteria bacterium]|nr:8-amino-7-oxononanoate synthase [Candidatus Riflebacteria bacterium]